MDKILGLLDRRKGADKDTDNAGDTDNSTYGINLLSFNYKYDVYKHNRAWPQRDSHHFRRNRVVSIADKIGQNCSSIYRTILL